MLARFVAGGADSFAGELFMTFIVSIAFITVIATVSGLCIAASTAFSYDFWFKVIKNGRQDHTGKIRTARISAIAIGILAIICSLAMKHMNVAYLSGLAFSIAATVNLPTIILAVYWKKLTTTGALIDIIGGTVISLFAVLAGPSIMGSNALFPLSNPGIVTIPLGFLITGIASLLTADKEAEQKYVELSVRSHSGLGAE
jgi:cation/acetate symporter